MFTPFPSVYPHYRWAPLPPNGEARTLPPAEVSFLSGLPVEEPVRMVFVAAGGYHSVAVSSAGEVWSWGSNSHAQLMRPSIASFDALPRRVLLPLMGGGGGIGGGGGGNGGGGGGDGVEEGRGGGGKIGGGGGNGEGRRGGGVGRGLGEGGGGVGGGVSEDGERSGGGGGGGGREGGGGGLDGGGGSGNGGGGGENVVTAQARGLGFVVGIVQTHTARLLA